MSWHFFNSPAKKWVDYFLTRLRILMLVCEAYIVLFYMTLVKRKLPRGICWHRSPPFDAALAFSAIVSSSEESVAPDLMYWTLRLIMMYTYSMIKRYIASICTEGKFLVLLFYFICECLYNASCYWLIITSPPWQLKLPCTCIKWFKCNTDIIWLLILAFLTSCCHLGIWNI